MDIVKSEPKWDDVKNPWGHVVIGYFVIGLIVFFGSIMLAEYIVPDTVVWMVFGGYQIMLSGLAAFMGLFAPTWRTRIGLLGIAEMIANILPYFLPYLGWMADTAPAQKQGLFTAWIASIAVGFVLFSWAMFTAKPKDNF